MTPRCPAVPGRRLHPVAAALGVLLLAGCHTSAAAAPARTTSVDAALHDALPADVLARGELRVVTDASYAPASSYAADGRTIIGFEPDLAVALGEVLGVRVTVSDHGFDELPGLVTGGAADLVMSAMTDTLEREQELDFVNYLSSGTSMVVQRGNPTGLTDLGDLCGHEVAVQSGTVQVDLVAHLQKNCDSPVTVLLAEDNDDALLELRTGRVDAVLNDYAPAAALTSDARTASHYQLASTVQYEPGLYGIGVDPERGALRDAVQGALARLISNGRYADVLHDWQVEDGAVRVATINAGAGLMRD